MTEAFPVPMPEQLKVDVGDVHNISITTLAADIGGRLKFTRDNLPGIDPGQSPRMQELRKLHNALYRPDSPQALIQALVAIKDGTTTTQFLFSDEGKQRLQFLIDMASQVDSANADKLNEAWIAQYQKIGNESPPSLIQTEVSLSDMNDGRKGLDYIYQYLRNSAAQAQNSLVKDELVELFHPNPDEPQFDPLDIPRKILQKSISLLHAFEQRDFKPVIDHLTTSASGLILVPDSSGTSEQMARKFMAGARLLESEMRID